MGAQFGAQLRPDGCAGNRIWAYSYGQMCGRLGARLRPNGYTVRSADMPRCARIYGQLRAVEIAVTPDGRADGRAVTLRWARNYEQLRTVRRQVTLKCAQRWAPIYAEMGSQSRAVIPIYAVQRAVTPKWARSSVRSYAQMCAQLAQLKAVGQSVTPRFAHSWTRSYAQMSTQLRAVRSAVTPR